LKKCREVGPYKNTERKKGQYEEGIEIPSGFKNLWAPSRHSGDNSLSPKDPSNSLTCFIIACKTHCDNLLKDLKCHFPTKYQHTKISAFSGASQHRMSLEIIVTMLSHPSNLIKLCISSGKLIRSSYNHLYLGRKARTDNQQKSSFKMIASMITELTSFHPV
jgi:hypothetical protein